MADFSGVPTGTVGEVDTLFAEWTTYEKLVSNDYMHHAALFSALVEAVAPGPCESLALLDLGCGDCAPLQFLLPNVRLRRYVGVDPSAAALQRARCRLEALRLEYDLIQGSAPDALAGIDAGFDLVVASYTLHHLSRRDKGAVMTACRPLLGRGGKLAVIDIFRDADESREAYLDRWEAHARETYRDLSPAEMEFLLRHVRACDRPETVETYRRLGTAAGFENVDSLVSRADGMERLLLLS